MKLLFAFFACAVFSASAFAATPPDHSKMNDNGMDMHNMHPSMQQDVPASQLPQKGKVVSFINTDQYTYIEVSQGKGKETVWLASTTVAVKKGDQIRFDDGMVMTNFYSKTLKRTFPKVLFVSKVVVVK